MIIEECKRIRELLNGLNGKIPKLKEELDKKLREQAELDDVALTAEILEEKGWEKKKEKADKNREEIAMLKSEIDEEALKSEILEEWSWQKKKEKAEENRAEITRIREIRMPYRRSSSRTAMSPPSSASTAKIKSVCCSGRK